MAKFADHMEKIAQGVTEGYQKIESGVVEGFGKITDACSGAMLNEDGSLKTGKIGDAVVVAYQKVEHAFVNTFMTKEGESVEDAKARMAAEQKAMIDTSLEASRNAGKISK